jgi:hypothetical protein
MGDLLAGVSGAEVMQEGITIMTPRHHRPHLRGLHHPQGKKKKAVDIKSPFLFVMLF